MRQLFPQSPARFSLFGRFFSLSVLVESLAIEMEPRNFRGTFGPTFTSWWSWITVRIGKTKPWLLLSVCGRLYCNCPELSSLHGIKITTKPASRHRILRFPVQLSRFAYPLRLHFPIGKSMLLIFLPYKSKSVARVYGDAHLWGFACSLLVGYVKSDVYSIPFSRIRSLVRSYEWRIKTRRDEIKRCASEKKNGGSDIGIMDSEIDARILRAGAR